MADVLQQIGKRGETRPGFARKVGKAAAIATAGAGIIDGGIDESEMSAKFIVCTMDEDTDGDIVVPQGCRPFLDVYKANPVVLWDHGETAGVQLPPIGKTEDRNGRFAARITNDVDIRATCYFHGLRWQGVPIGEEAFHLVREKFLRGASIGFLPEEAVPNGYGRGKRYNLWRWHEWSITPLPANQMTLAEDQVDTLRRCISRGQLKTKSLVDHYSRLLPAAPVWANGVDLEPLMSKRRVASIQFAKNLFPDAVSVQKWLKTNGRGQGKVESVGAVWSVGMGPGGVCTGTKNLAKGVTALLVTKADKDDEEEDKPKEDDAPPVADKSDKPEGDVPPEAEDDETPAPEGEEEVPPGEEAAPDAAPVDHSNKQGAKDLAVLCEHFDALVAAVPDILGRTDNPKVSSIIEKVQALATKIHQMIYEGAQAAYPGLDLDAIKPGSMAPEPAADMPAPAGGDADTNPAAPEGQLPPPGTGEPIDPTPPAVDEDKEKLNKTLRMLQESRQVSKSWRVAA